MSLGVLLIIAGVFIAIFPELLSLIVATVLVIIGIVICFINYNMRKMQKTMNDPFSKFFIKF